MAELSADPVTSAASDLDDLKSALVDLNKVSIELFVGRPLKEPLKGWRRLDLSDDFHRTCRREIVKQLDEDADRTPVPLEFDAVSDQTVGIVDLASFAAFEGPLSSLPSGSTPCGFNGDIGHLTMAKHTAKRVNLPTGESVSLFQPAGSGLVLKKPTLAVLSDQKSLVAPGGPAIIDFPTDYCAMIWRANVYVLDEKKFASLSKFDEVVKASAKVAFEKLRNSTVIGFEDISLVEKALHDSAEFRRKFAAADKAGAIDRLSADKVEELISGYDISIKHKKKFDKLILDPNLSDRKGRSDLIDVVSDRFSKSLTTDTAYRMHKASLLTKKPTLGGAATTPATET